MVLCSSLKTAVKQSAQENGKEEEKVFGRSHGRCPWEEVETADGDAEMKVDAESLDPFAVEDVTDIGSGEPLFANFAYEDCFEGLI